MNTFILVLLPWFIGQLLSNLSFGKRLIIYLVKRKPFQRGFPKQAKRKSMRRSVYHFVLGLIPLFLTAIACFYSIRHIVLSHKDILPFYLPIVLLFSFLFFIATVWLRASTSHEDDPPEDKGTADCYKIPTPRSRLRGAEAVCFVNLPFSAEIA